MSSNPEAAFEGKDLACQRGETLVFDNLSFAVGVGEALVVLGPNGAGKSTLLRLMAGLLGPSAGHISWGGEDIAEDAGLHARRVGFVGHSDALKPAWTVGENLRFWGQASGIDAKGDVILGALDALGMADLVEVPVSHLSRGQARRCALARLLLAPRPLWVLDEPTASLDEASSQLLAGLIDRHCAQGHRAVIATHRALGLASAKQVEIGDLMGAPS